MRAKTILGWILLPALAAGCNEFEDPPPSAPIVNPSPPSQFQIAGRWDGTTDQGRPLRFDISTNGVVLNGTVSIHHDCTGGRLVLQLGDYEAQVSGDSFSVTLNWRVDEPTKFYVGKLTLSGRFEGDELARGGFVNSITDKQADNLGVCRAVDGTWEASRAP